MRGKNNMPLKNTNKGERMFDGIDNNVGLWDATF